MFEFTVNYVTVFWDKNDFCLWGMMQDELRVSVVALQIYILEQGSPTFFAP